jgi:hypothetical protein
MQHPVEYFRPEPLLDAVCKVEAAGHVYDEGDVAVQLGIQDYIIPSL